MLRYHMMTLYLPWWDPGDELQYSTMSLSSPDNIDRRKVFRGIRKWYKEALGVTIDKHTLSRIWKARFETRSLTEEEMNGYINKYAEVQNAKAIEDDSDSNSQEGVVGEAE